MFFKVWFWLQSKHEQRSLLLFRTPQWIMKVQTKLIVSYHFWAGSDFSTLLEQNQFCLLNGNVINILPIHWLHCKIPSRYFYLEFKQLISSKSDISKKPVIYRIEDQTVFDWTSLITWKLAPIKQSCMQYQLTGRQCTTDS